MVGPKLLLATVAVLGQELREEALRFACRPTAPSKGKAVRTVFLGPMMNGAMATTARHLIVTSNAHRPRDPSVGKCKHGQNVNVTLVECPAGEITKRLAVVAPTATDDQCLNKSNHNLNDPMDTRILVARDRAWILCSEVYTQDVDVKRGQFLGSLNITTVEVLKDPRLVIGDGPRVEKNWVPFTLDDDVFVTRWLVDDVWNRTVTIGWNGDDLVKYHADGQFLRHRFMGKHISGGTNAVRLNATHFLAIGHTRTDPPRVYKMFAYIFTSEPPFTIVASSPEFNLRTPPRRPAPRRRGLLREHQGADIFDPAAVRAVPRTQFPMSLSLPNTSRVDDDDDDSDDLAVLVWGSEDIETYLSVLRLTTLLHHCHPHTPLLAEV